MWQMPGGGSGRTIRFYKTVTDVLEIVVNAYWDHVAGPNVWVKDLAGSTAARLSLSGGNLQFHTVLAGTTTWDNASWTYVAANFSDDGDLTLSGNLTVGGITSLVSVFATSLTLIDSLT